MTSIPGYSWDLIMYLRHSIVLANYQSTNDVVELYALVPTSTRTQAQAKLVYALVNYFTSQCN